MKIAINALAVDGGGGQTYLENLLPELDRLDPATDYVILLREKHAVNIPPLSAKFKVVTFPIIRPFLIGRVLLEQLVLPAWLKKEKIDLLYSPADATTLLSHCPVVLAMRNPNLYVTEDIGWSAYYKMKFGVLSFMARVSTKKANQVIFVSEASRKMINNKIFVPPEKSNVIHHGVSSIFLQSSPHDPDVEKILEGKKPYVLSISSIYRYKNYVRLIEAFAQIADRLKPTYHLLIAGSSFDNAYYKAMLNRIKELKVEHRVHYIGGFPLKQLASLYQQAALFASPSFLETFGHTLVEAMASQIPIIAADIAPTREIVGEAAHYFDPFSIDSIAGALIQGLTDGPLRQELVRKGGNQIKNFSWELCAHQTLGVFYRALGKYYSPLTNSSLRASASSSIE